MKLITPIFQKLFQRLPIAETKPLDEVIKNLHKATVKIIEKEKKLSQQTITDLQEKVIKAEKSLEESNKSNKAIRLQFEKLNEELSNTKEKLGEIDQIKKNNASINKRNEDLLDENQRLSEKIEELKNDKKKAAEETKKLQEKLQAIADESNSTTQSESWEDRLKREAKVRNALRSHPMNSGILTKEESENILNADSVLKGTWILRFDQEAKAMFVSQKKDHGVKHYSCKEASSAEGVFKKFGEDKHFSSKYDRQVQLNLGTGETAKGLTEKAKKSAINVKTIDLVKREGWKLNPKADGEFACLKELTHRSKIYFIGHGGEGVPYIESNLNSKGFNDVLDVNEIVRILKDNAPQLILGENAPHLQEMDGGPRIKISLVVCRSGDSDNSLAHQLSKKLFEEKIPAEILGRKGPVSRSMGTKGFRKTVNGRHHHNGDKISVITINNETKAKDVVYN